MIQSNIVNELNITVCKPYKHNNTHLKKIKVLRYQTTRTKY